MISIPILAISEPIGPIEKGITYIVRPFMQPSYSPLIVSFNSLGSIQLLVGPASSSLTEAMYVRPSTRATSDGSELKAKLLGRFSSFSLIAIPLATISFISLSYSSVEPSHQHTLSGLHMALTSSTQLRSFLLFVIFLPFVICFTIINQDIVILYCI